MLNLKPLRIVNVIAIVLGLAACARAEDARIEFTKETLDNGLRVIYAPLHNAPVVHVRVLYHVGSRDETPDRQGFAHMFEHMMFRGSAHVPPELHMKLIGVAGGNSNAFTSFDQTTYVNTLPSNNTEMALYLEADRMASFKVNDDIFQTERKVVAEEWRMRYANQPLGTMFQDLLKTAFKTHTYRWTPIGDMDQLRQASSSELQTFFNTYYVPNNACLIIAGDIDVEQTKQWVRKYYGWIPKGPEIIRNAKPEADQTEERRLVVNKPNVPLTHIEMGFKTVGYRSDDHYALSMLGDVLSSGRTGRLDKAFVNGASPTCLQVGAGDYQMEDPSLFVVNAVVQQGVDPDQVEKDVLASVLSIGENPVTQEELDKVRTQARQAIIRSKEKCEDIASQLGEEEVFGGDADRVNQALAKIDALKPEDLTNVAKKYLKKETLTVVQYRPAAEGAKAAATQAEAAAKEANATSNAGVQPSTEKVAPRVSQFPEGYPTEPPVNQNPPKVTFNKGVEAEVEGVKVITLADHRLPLVNISLIMRGGSDAEPEGKEGLAGLTAQMLRRGSAGISFLDFSADLESRGISIEASDDNDNTRLSISCTTDQLNHAVMRGAQVLVSPDFPADEFKKLQRQAMGRLMQSLSDPERVVERELSTRLYEGGPQGRLSTPQSIAGITIDDVRKWYDSVYTLDKAIIIISGDIDPEQGKEVASKLLSGTNNKPFERRTPPPQADYTLKPQADKRRLVLVDNPEGKQATIRMGIRAYDIRNDDKFAGNVAGQILSAGIESRLNKYVRAEKGLTYGCYAVFQPSRHGGDFSGDVDTNPETAGAAIEAMLKVFDDLKKDLVTEQEMAEARSRVAGSMVMGMQTIAQQARRRADQILNDYPIDYYDKFPERIAQVKAEDVREVMKKYVADDKMLFVTVAPAAQVQKQLQSLGEVEVIPMPLNDAPKPK